MAQSEAFRTVLFCAALIAGTRAATAVASDSSVRSLPNLGFSLTPPAGVAFNPSKDVEREVWLDGVDLYGTAWLEMIPSGADAFERATGLLVEFWIENAGNASPQSAAPEIQPFKSASGLTGRRLRMLFKRASGGSITAIGFIIKSDGDDVLIVEWRMEKPALESSVDSAMKGLIKTKAPSVATTPGPRPATPRPADLFREINAAPAADWAVQTLAATEGPLTVERAPGDAVGIVCANPSDHDALLPIAGLSATDVPVGKDIIRFEVSTPSNPAGLGNGVGFLTTGGDAVILLIRPDRTHALFLVTPEGRWRFFRSSPDSIGAWLPSDSISGNGPNVIRAVRTETGVRFEINSKPARQVGLSPLLPVSPAAAVASGATLRIADVPPAVRKP